MLAQTISRTNVTARSSTTRPRRADPTSSSASGDTISCRRLPGASRIGLRGAGAQHLDLRSRLLEAHVRLQARDHVEQLHLAAARLDPHHGERVDWLVVGQPGRRWKVETEIAREHADNRRRAPVHGDAAAQPRRIAPEDALEESVRHDQRRSLGRGCQTTVLEAGARQRPEVVGHPRDARSGGGAGCGNGLVADAVGDHPIERPRVRLPVGEIGPDDHRHRKGRLVVTGGHPDQAIRIRRR